MRLEIRSKHELENARIHEGKCERREVQGFDEGCPSVCRKRVLLVLVDDGRK